MQKNFLSFLNSFIRIMLLVILIVSMGLWLFSSTSKEVRIGNLEPMRNYPEYKEYKKVNPIVRLYVNGSFVCTGFVASRQYVMTAGHCLDDLNQEVVVYSDDETFATSGRVVGISEHMDQGLIEAQIFDNIKPIKVDFTGELSTTPALDIAACGFPGGQSKELCTAGRLTGIHFFLRIGVGTLYKGMSGGPVYARNSKGEQVVVGMNSAVLKDYIMVAPAVNFIHNMRLVEATEGAAYDQK